MPGLGDWLPLSILAALLAAAQIADLLGALPGMKHLERPLHTSSESAQLVACGMQAQLQAPASPPKMPTTEVPADCVTAEAEVRVQVKGSTSSP